MPVKKSKYDAINSDPELGIYALITTKQIN